MPPSSISWHCTLTQNRESLWHGTISHKIWISISYWLNTSSKRMVSLYSARIQTANDLTNVPFHHPLIIVKIYELSTKVKGQYKVKKSRNRPGVAQRIPRSLGSQISMTFSTWRWWGRQPHVPAAFILRKCSWYSFSLGAESTPGPRCGQKEYVTEKSSDTTGNRSRDRPTSSAAP